MRGYLRKAGQFRHGGLLNVGPAIASVDRANGVSGAQGRKSLSTEALVQSTGAGVRERGGLLAVVLAVGVAVFFGA